MGHMPQVPPKGKGASRTKGGGVPQPWATAYLAPASLQFLAPESNQYREWVTQTARYSGSQFPEVAVSYCSGRIEPHFAAKNQHSGLWTQGSVVKNGVKAPSPEAVNSTVMEVLAS